MNFQHLVTRRRLTVTTAVLISDIVAGCHGGEIIFGNNTGVVAAGQAGQTASGATTQSGTGGFTIQVTSAIASGGWSASGGASNDRGGSVNASGANAATGGALAFAGATALGLGGVPMGNNGGTSGASGASGGNLTLAGTTGSSFGGLPISNIGGAVSTGGAPATGGTSEPPPPPTITLVTSALNVYWKTDASCTEVPSATADVSVEDSIAAQTWEGFGGAFNERGWSYLTSPALQDEAMALLFGVDGCRFALGRIPIGASDFAMDRYTLDENAGDYAMAYFSIDRDRQKLIPYVKAALAINTNIRLWACPWTPPTWMKSGQKAGLRPSPFDGGTMKDDDAILTAYAQYLIRFVQGYALDGIKIETVSPQNEPSYEQNYPSCLWPAGLYTKFLGKYLGPAFDAAGLTARIMLGTVSNSTADPAIIASVMGDAAAKSYVKVAGMQWDMLDVIASLKQYTKDLNIWQTEHKCGNYPWASGYQYTAPNDHAYGVESWGLIRSWIRAGVSAYYVWNMVLDKTGKGIDTTRDWAQNALLVVDSGKIVKTPAYFVFRHLSQFVAPGAKVLATTGGDALAFKNPDGSIITVMFNKDSAKKVILSVGGKKLQFDMPGVGWATVSYKP